MRIIATLLVTACLTQGAWAQFKLIGPGFLPDLNGTNRDDSPIKKVSPQASAQATFKNCPECPEMVVIPAGSFQMGSNDYSAERPNHRVNIASFLMSKGEVTQGQWKAVLGSNPSHFWNCGPDCPVENVSWDDVQKYIAKINQITSLDFRLPSEAEWEYAARAGTITAWSFGNDESKLTDYAWFRDNARGNTHLRGQKLPNAFGLFDVHGNVWEWTQDCWHDNYDGAPFDGSAWLSGCQGNYRVLRGGSWDGASVGIRSALRLGYHQQFKGKYYGFRLARNL